MGLLDKVKTQAATATAMAKDAAQKGQAKFDALQAKRAADGLLRDLGAVVYAQHKGRASSSAGANIERLTAALDAHEREHGPIDLGPEWSSSFDTGGSDAGSGSTGGAGDTDAGSPGGANGA